MLPRIFMIETTLACNLKCPECAMGSGKISRRGPFMSFDQFKTIFDRISPYVKYLYPYSWGEPMLNRDIIPMIRYASRVTRTNISTNALTLDREKAEELITSGVDDIIVSIDGATQETYSKYRVGGELEKALDALKCLVQFNSRHGNRVNITPQFIVFRHNQHEMSGFRELCRPLGLEPSFKAPYIRMKGGGLSCSDYPEYIRPHYPDLASLRSAMSFCPDPRFVFTILIDGSAVICCNDTDNRTCLGNIFEQGVMEIWDSPRYTEFRRDIITGCAPDFCVENCRSYFIDDQAGAADEDEAGDARKKAALPRRVQRRKFNDLGEELYRAGNIKDAVDAFVRATSSEEEAVAAFNNLAVIYWEMGDGSKAAECLNTALEADPCFRPAVLNYGGLLEKAARYREACHLYGRYLSRHPDDEELLQLLKESMSRHCLKPGPDSSLHADGANPPEWPHLQRLEPLKLYAGDIPDMPEYDGFTGLSISRSDRRHILHDITCPFPLRDSSVDIFQAEDVFEHIPHAGITEIVNEIYRILKPGGLFRLSVPDYRCDVLAERSVRDARGNIVFDPGGGGTPDKPGHLWFPVIENVRPLLGSSKFAEGGSIDYLHYYEPDGSFVMKPIDYSRGHVSRTPDFDERVQSPPRPMSMVVDLVRQP